MRWYKCKHGFKCFTISLSLARFCFYLSSWICICRFLLSVVLFRTQKQTQTHAYTSRFSLLHICAHASCFATLVFSPQLRSNQLSVSEILVYFSQHQEFLPVQLLPPLPLPLQHLALGRKYCGMLPVECMDLFSVAISWSLLSRQGIVRKDPGTNQVSNGSAWLLFYIYFKVI